jgi:predicted transcriptional regulator
MVDAPYNSRFAQRIRTRQSRPASVGSGQVKAEQRQRCGNRSKRRYTVYIVYIVDKVKAMTVTLSARVPEDVRDQVDTLAKALKRDRAWIVEQAVRRYLADETQFIAAVAQGRAEIAASHFVAHEDVIADLDAIEAEIDPQ